MSDDDDVSVPLHELERAIEKFMHDTGQLEEGFITGWALGVSKAKLNPENVNYPITSGMTYTFGPSTSVIQLAGLGRYLSIVADEAMRPRMGP